MYQTSKRGLQVLLWTDLLKGFMIALGWLLREPTTINYPFEKGPLSPVRLFSHIFLLEINLIICRDFVVNMLYVVMHQAKNVVLHVNFAKRFVQLK
jgi:hypothetical protein